MPPIWTEHALERWKERFPDINLKELYSSARRITRRQRKVIKRSCPINAEKYMNKIFKGRYVLIYSDRKQFGLRIAFVVQKDNLDTPESIVTVFPFGE